MCTPSRCCASSLFKPHCVPRRGYEGKSSRWKVESAEKPVARRGKSGNGGEKRTESSREDRRRRRELEVARGDAEYTYRMPPDVAVRPAAAHLRSALLCFSSQLFESAEQVHASLYIEYRVLALVVHWWYKRHWSAHSAS